MKSMDTQDSLAEWSKALAQGASPQGRGFEPHSCHFISSCSCLVVDKTNRHCSSILSSGHLMVLPKAAVWQFCVRKTIIFEAIFLFLMDWNRAQT